MISDHYLNDWDEKYHALVSKNLIKHPLKPTLYDNTIIKNDYRNWIANNVWLEKPPVPLWSMAISISFFGTNEFAVRFPSLIMSLLAVYLTYLIGFYLFDKRIGLLAAFLHSINGIVLELMAGKLSSDHVETFFDVMIEIAVFFCILAIIKKNRYHITFLCGIFIGLAILSKWLPALIVFPVWLTGVIFSKKYTLKEIILHFLLISIGSIIIALPWFYYILKNFPDEARWVLGKFIHAYSNTLEGHNAPWWYYINYVEIIFGELVYFPLLIAVYHMIKNKDDWALKLLSIWWIIPVVIFSFAETKRHTYLLISAPAFFLITAWYWIHLKDGLDKKLSYKWFRYVLMALLVALPIRLFFERVKPFQHKNRNPEWAQQIRELKLKISDKKVVIFNSEHPVETMFYTDFMAYDYTPDSVTIQKFTSSGYNSYVYENGILRKCVPK